MNSAAPIFMAQSDQAQVVPMLSELCREIHEVSTLPHVAMRVMEIANDPNAGAREMKQAMEADVALSTRVLRCVNSSAYAIRTKITNLQHAISFLGVKQIRNLAMTASISKLFANEESIGTYNRLGLWRHMIAVGVCARLVAARLSLKEFEDVFLAGLLHDVGIILEDQHVNGAFVEVVNELPKASRLCEVEQKHLKFDHTMLGSRLASAWRLPAGIVDSIRHHHDSVSYDGTCAATVRCVELANFICSLTGMPSVGVQLVEFPKAVISALSLSKDDLVVLAKDFDRELKNNQTLFQI